MIIWIASYPKNGNTWLRALLSAYYFTKDGNFIDDTNLHNIAQFPEKKYFNDFKYNQSIPGDTSKFWIKAQEKINSDKKIRFFKTHNSLSKIGDIEFTDKNNSLGGIYIVRDPRNVISSMSNHFEMNYDEALDFMKNEKKFTFDHFKKNDYSDFQFVSSWENNYRSWKENKIMPVKFIRYEDLSKETFSVFKDIVNFIDKICNNINKFNKKKLQRAIDSTSFEKLKKLEKNKGFLESITSKGNKKKIPFFHLGPENNWKKNFNSEFKEKLNNSFKKNLIELNYI